jgi:hypothetical protein
MDRDTDTAAFLIVRTDAAGNPLKSFVVGTNASGAGNGEFVVNDLGTAVGGAGVRRMTITNAGETHFTGNVRVPGFFHVARDRAVGEDVGPAEAPEARLARLEGSRTAPGE